MPGKKITRKVISKTPVEVAEDITSEKEFDSSKSARSKKVCSFCLPVRQAGQSKVEPTYTDLTVLRRFTSDRAKIVPKLKSGLCAKHQRAVTRNIKYARHLALLPFVPKV